MYEGKRCSRREIYMLIGSVVVVVDGSGKRGNYICIGVDGEGGRGWSEKDITGWVRIYMYKRSGWVAGGGMANGRCLQKERNLIGLAIDLSRSRSFH